LIDVQLGFGDIECRLRILEILLAYNRICRECLAPLVLSAGVNGVGLRRFDIRAGLRDLLRAAAVVESLNGLTLCRSSRFRLCDLRLQTARIQACQNLAPFYAVAFLHQHRGNPLAVVEGELDLPQVHVSVQY
jgi:hypothetical protein